MNIGEEPILSTKKLVTTIACQVNGKVQYALEGSIFIGGAVVQWLRDGLGIIRTSAEVEELANRVDSTGGVYLVPAFAGLGAPHWEQDARGTITGITRGTTAAHIARAAVESIAFQTMDVLKAMEEDSGLEIKELRVDGGATANNMLMQFQADLLKATVIRPQVTEVTASGAAYLAGLAIGFWENIDEIKAMWHIDRSFTSQDNPKLEAVIQGWNKAVEATKAAIDTK